MSEHLARAAAACAFIFAAGAATAAPGAPAAADLVFNKPFFENVRNGSILTYTYVRVAKNDKLRPSFEDKVDVTVGPQGDENSLSIALFSGDRGLTLKNMSRTGAPLVPALLEQDVQDIYKFAGGSPFYLRNRFMEAIRSESAEPAKIEFGGRTLDAWKVTLKPFAKDAHRAKLGDFADSTYELTFSDDVPGGLYALRTVAPDKDGAPLVTEELTLQPVGAAAGEEKKTP